MSHNKSINCISKDDDDDNMSLADIMSLRISTSIEEKNSINMWNHWYHQQMQTSYYQLQYLQQQHMLSMMTSRRFSNSSRTPLQPVERKKSIGRRIKKVFGMTDHSDRLPVDSALDSPTPSTISTSSSSSKKSLSFNPIVQLHETFSATEYDRRCDTETTCQKLTPILALQIKEELNHFKLNDMFVHLDSRQYTHFFM